MRVPMFLAAAAALAGCASSSPPTPVVPPGQVPAYLTAQKGCAVVAGGGIGSSFADPKITSFWHQVNAEVTTQLHDRLAADGYRVVKLIVPTEQAPDNQKVVVQKLAQNQCNRLIQVSHTVSEDASGKFFRFDVAAMRMQPKGDRAPGAGGTNVTRVGEFQHDYRFARSAEVFSSFRTGTFAGTVYGDLKQSGALETLH
jgi:hypothetical protein